VPNGWKHAQREWNERKQTEGRPINCYQRKNHGVSSKNPPIENVICFGGFLLRIVFVRKWKILIGRWNERLVHLVLVKTNYKHIFVTKIRLNGLITKFSFTTCKLYFHVI
jgi:hypothetical protein